MARNVRLAEIGYSADDVPALVFEAEMQDLQGSFDTRFAVTETEEGDTVFVVAGRGKQVFGRLPITESTIELIESIIEERGYIAAVNYDVEVQDRGLGYELPMLGRMVGGEYDWVEKTELPDDMVDEFREIRDYAVNHS